MAGAGRSHWWHAAACKALPLGHPELLLTLPGGPALPPCAAPRCRASGPVDACPQNATDSQFWGVEQLVNSTLSTFPRQSIC